MGNEICVNCGHPRSDHAYGCDHFTSLTTLCKCPAFTARPDEGDKMSAQVERKIDAAVAYLRNPVPGKLYTLRAFEAAGIVRRLDKPAASDLAIAEAYRCGYESGKSEVEAGSDEGEGDGADAFRQFAAKESELLRLKRELAAERTRREQIFTELKAMLESTAGSPFDFGVAVSAWALREFKVELDAQDSSNTSESGADLEANQTKSDNPNPD